MKIFTIGLTVLGIGFIIWGGSQIWGQSHVVTDIADESLSYLNSEVDDVEPKGVNQGVVESIPNEILYPIRPRKGDYIGTLIIPALGKEMPIYHGTDEDELKEGVGHFERSVLPGEKNNSVLSGHRDTIFRNFDELEIGDTFIVITSAGKFTYEIMKTQIVEGDDKTIIVPTDEAVLTVTTCYPFGFIGPAPDRYILTATLIERELDHPLL